MKKTLLQMTQEILAAMDSDEITDISDTIESRDVAATIEAVYWDMLSRFELPEHEQYFNLEATSDTNLPTVLTIPTNVTKIVCMWNDEKESGATAPYWVPLTEVTFDEMVAISNNNRTRLASTIDTVAFTTNDIGPDAFNLTVRNDKHPDYYTVINNDTVLFDSYDDTINGGNGYMDESLIVVKGIGYPAFTQSNSFTPDLSPLMFSYLRNKAKFRCFVEKKQQVNQEAGQEIRRLEIILNKRKNNYTNYSPFMTNKARYGKRKA